jgi:hypothetical protein
VPAEPRFTAYTLVFPPGSGDYVFGQYAFQSRAPEPAESRAAAVRSAFTGPNAPAVLERGSFTDSAGVHNAVWYAYWLDTAKHERWIAEGGRARAQRLQDTSAACWWEEAAVPVLAQSALQTHPTSAYPISGLAQLLPQRVEDTHDYWGAIRDRIPDKAVHAGPVARPLRTEDGDTVEVSVDGGLCMIRFAQDWEHSTVFYEPFHHDVLPVMREAVSYLQQHPEESGCVAARDVRECGADGAPLGRNSVLAWFSSMQSVLDWTRTHPTHQAIYAAFFKMIGESGADLDVALWNEAAVLPPGSVTATYTRCHDRTGFLPLVPKNALP